MAADTTKNKGWSNIIPLSERTPEERREIASKGGKAKAEKDRKSKEIAETFRALLSIEMQSAGSYMELFKDYKSGEKMSLNLEGQTLLTYMCADIVHDALKGYGREKARAREIILKYIDEL